MKDWFNVIFNSIVKFDSRPDGLGDFTPRKIDYHLAEHRNYVHNHCEIPGEDTRRAEYNQAEMLSVMSDGAEWDLGQGNRNEG